MKITALIISFFMICSTLGAVELGQNKGEIFPWDVDIQADKATINAVINIPTRTTPANVISDMWATTAGLFFNDNGVVKNVFDPTNVVIVNSVLDFGIPSGDGKIYLETGTRYYINTIIYNPFTFVIPTSANVEIRSVQMIDYPLIYVGLGNMFESENMGNGALYLEELAIGCPSGTVFYIKGVPPFPSNIPTINLHKVGMLSINALGTIESCNLYALFVLIFDVGDGLALINPVTVGLNMFEMSFWKNRPNTNMISFYGSIFSVSVGVSSFTPGTNESVFYISPTSNTSSGTVVGATFVPILGGKFFAENSLDQSYAPWTYAANAGISDSHTYGLVDVAGNTSITIVDTGIPATINVTADWNVIEDDRFEVSTANETIFLTYIDSEDIIVDVKYSALIVPDGAALTNTLAIYVGKNCNVIERLEDKGSISVGAPQKLYVNGTVRLSQNDFLCFFVENESGGRDINVQEVTIDGLD